MPAAPDAARSAPPGTLNALTVQAEFALVRATVRQAVLEDDVAEQVIFCFSRDARHAGPAKRLALLGPDVDTSVEAIAVDLVADDHRCLLARFAAGTPVNRYSVAVILDGAARDVRTASVMSTTPLSTSPQMAVVAGGTSAPDLVSVKLQPTLDPMTLTFDEQLDGSVPRARRRSRTIRSTDACTRVTTSKASTATPVCCNRHLQKAWSSGPAARR
jgi:hypothetical protein